ncbi:hypothetical protein [Anaerofustis butyriciformans]|uniref:hypothetical protein n=1 Tax=Anaerofustis butyriciformans TaxID=3108533 RepID=UPI002E31CE45|nr:hypothetical protein [Anaerofustis sp. HA2171]
MNIIIEERMMLMKILNNKKLFLSANKEQTSILMPHQLYELLTKIAVNIGITKTQLFNLLFYIGLYNLYPEYFTN